MKKAVLILILIFAMAEMSYSQFIEDALRYAQTNLGVSPRSAGLGVAFYGISDDFSGLFYNPAGLSLIRKTSYQ